MPLERALEQWATLAQEVTTPEMSRAVGCAFAALSCEQLALQYYRSALQGAFCFPTLSSLLNKYDFALEEVQQAVGEWTTVAQLLENEAACRSDAVCAGELRALVVAALTHCQRLGRVALVVAAERQAHYQRRLKQQREVPS
jgi:hypothetical protein